MMGDWAVQTLLASWWVEFDGTPYGANDVADKDTYVLNLSGCGGRSQVAPLSCGSELHAYISPRIGAFELASQHAGPHTSL